MRVRRCWQMAPHCCYAALKIDVAYRTFVPRARETAWMDWQIDTEPTLMPSPKEYPEEIWGIEDPRITFVPELQQYAVTYTSYSRGGPGVSLALTKDFRSFERYGVIMPPDDKDSALLPRRINGYWALIHRPMTPLGSHMWISYSPDLRYWGRHRLMLEARRGAWWDANKIGLSPPPIETSRGWLVLYHGVRHTPSGCLYRLGLALFDLENPEKCLLRGDSWIFGPEAEYERHGDVDDVVFPCGYTMDPDGDTLNIYYGAADCSIALARASVPHSTELAGCQRKLRSKARSGPMNPLHWMIQFAFGCHHRHISRVFTIKRRTYKVCLDCGHEFGLPDADTTNQYSISEIRTTRLKKISRIHAA